MSNNLLRKRWLSIVAFLGIAAVPAGAVAGAWRCDGNAALLEKFGITEEIDCRYLDLDGDGVDEVLFPLPGLQDPLDRRWITYGIARKNTTGTWMLLKKKGATDDSVKSLATMTLGYANSFVAFDNVSASGAKKRVFSERHPRYGIYGFQALMTDGLVSLSRERILKDFSVGEFEFLRRLKIIPEVADLRQGGYGKERALRLTSYGCLNVYTYSDFAVVAWMPDTASGKYQAVPLGFFEFPTKLRDKIAGVILPRGNETRVGVLFDENQQYLPEFLLFKIRSSGEHRLSPEVFSMLEHVRFSEKDYEKIFTEFFPDDGRVGEGKSLPVVWFEISPDSSRHCIVSAPFCDQEKK